MNYVRFCTSVYDKGKLINPDAIWDHIKDSSKEHYVSVFQYNEDHFKKFQITGSVKGIKDTTTNKLLFDLDNKEDPSLAQKDAKELINRLIKFNIKEKDVEIYFSGNKGIHVVVTLNRQITPTLAYSLAVNKFGKDLKTLDTSVYDAAQIIRIAGTKHSSGLYKIPLTYKELQTLTIDQIKEKAKSLDNVTEDFSWEEVNPSEEFYKVEEQKFNTSSNYSHVDLTQKPKNWRNCKWSLVQGNFNAGQRHNALLTIAATARGLGYDKDTAYYMCKASLKKQAARTGTEDFPKEELWVNIIEGSVYKEGWEGGQFTCEKPGWLQTYCHSLDHPCKNDQEEKEFNPQKISDIKSQFKDFVMNIDKNTVKTGLREIDIKLPLTIGMNLGIVGAPSAGKTALALEILKNTSKSGVVSVFASLDMHRNRLFEKLLYKVSDGKPRNEIYNMFQNDTYSELVDKINEDYGNVYFYDRSSPTVSDIRRYIDKINLENPNKVKLVMLDYFERVNSERSDETAASKDISGQLQDLVNDYNICLITLVQPNKHSLGGGPDTPILSYTAIKGSSFLYQSFRSIISLWRPFLNPKTKDKDKYIQFAILKNDLGELDTIDYAFEGRTGTIREFASPEERTQLQEWLKEKEREKDGKSKDDWE